MVRTYPLLVAFAFIVGCNNSVAPPGAGPDKFGTDAWFELEPCPPEWGDKFLQVRVFA